LLHIVSELDFVTTSRNLSLVFHIAIYERLCNDVAYVILLCVSVFWLSSLARLINYMWLTYAD